MRHDTSLVRATGPEPAQTFRSEG